MQINQFYSYILLIFSLINLIFSLITLKKVGLKKSSSVYYFFLSIAISVYSFGYSQEILQTNLPAINKWLKIEYLGGAFVPSLWLIVISELSGYVETFTNKVKNFLILFGFFILFMFFTNEWHKLYYSSQSLIFYKDFVLISTGKGFLYIIFLLYEFLVLFYTMFISLSIMHKENNHMKNQFRLILWASIVIAGAMVLNISGGHYYKFDFLPMASVFFQILLGLSIFRFGLINYIPIAYEFIIKNMKEGLLVVDKEGLIVNYNEAFANLANINNKILGKPVKELSIYSEGLESFFKDKISYVLDKKPLSMELNGKHYKINYTLVGEAFQVYAWVFLFYDITKEQEYLKQVEYYATYDALTGLLNRRAFYDELEAIRDVLESICVVTFDFDHFKTINDTFGHLAGDMVLQHYGTTINNYARDKGGITARFGGEEFVLALLDYQLDEAKIFAEELRSLIEKESLIYEDFTLKITGSFGVAQLKEGEEITNLLRRADKALYNSKETGRNRISISE